MPTIRAEAHAEVARNRELLAPRDDDEGRLEQHPSWPIDRMGRELADACHDRIAQQHGDRAVVRLRVDPHERRGHEGTIGQHVAAMEIA
jgi:hypothetical protein